MCNPWWSTTVAEGKFDKSSWASAPCVQRVCDVWVGLQGNMKKAEEDLQKLVVLKELASRAPFLANKT